MHIDQIIAECDCPQPLSCRVRGYCMAAAPRAGTEKGDGYDVWNAGRHRVEDEDILRTASEGVKFDAEKTPYHLIAPEMLEGTGRVLQYGAVKYAPRNWEKGMEWSRPFSAMMRHMWDWWRGEDCDPETGMSHLWHAACCLMFLMAYERRRIGTDDRPKGDDQ